MDDETTKKTEPELTTTATEGLAVPEAGTLTLGRATALRTLPKAEAGRVVRYVARAESHQGLEGGVEYPATLVRVFSDTCATIAVFTESAQFPLHVIHSATYDAAGAEGTWHWPVLK